MDKTENDHHQDTCLTPECQWDNRHFYSRLLLKGSCHWPQIKQASLQAGVSTASMGKFDRRLEGEKEGERRLGSKRRKFDSVSAPAKEENARVRTLIVNGTGNDAQQSLQQIR